MREHQERSIDVPYQRMSIKYFSRYGGLRLVTRDGYQEASVTV